MLDPDWIRIKTNADPQHRGRGGGLVLEKYVKNSFVLLYTDLERKMFPDAATRQSLTSLLPLSPGPRHPAPQEIIIIWLSVCDS
jgi:hypothetical protein